jgi:CubicO group peptidase (beta-lactamase class C family)
MRKLLLVVALCLALPAIARPAIAQTRPDLSAAALSAWADSVYGEAVRTGRIDGAVVSIVVDGEPRFLSGYGYANTQTRAPVDPETTTFRLGSVSKTFAAVAIAQLQAKGRLPGLNEPISSFLGARAPLDETDTPITLRHLLTHSAGLDEQLFGLATFRQDEQTSPQPRIVRAPGIYTSYSNTGFGLLATAAESASGLSYAEVLQQQIFTPLGMSGARLRTTIAPDTSLATGSYRAPDGTVWPMATDRMLRLDRAASGGVEASGRDMQAYMIALLDRGAEGKIPDLDASTFAPLFQEQARRHPAVNGFGMGFFLSDWNGMRVVEHGGVLPGARAYLHLIPEWNVGVFTAISGEPAGPPSHRSRKMGLWTQGRPAGASPAEPERDARRKPLHAARPPCRTGARDHSGNRLRDRRNLRTRAPEQNQHRAGAGSGARRSIRAPHRGAVADENSRRWPGI